MIRAALCKQTLSSQAHGHAHGCVLKIARRHGCAHGHAWDHAGTDNLAGMAMRMAMRSAGIFQKKK